MLAGLSAAWGRAVWAGIPEHDAVRAEPADQLDGQVGQDVSEAGDVVAGVHDDEDAASPGRHCPACTSRVTTSRSWVAVTAVASSHGPSRIAAGRAVQDVRPVSRAATKE